MALPDISLAQFNRIATGDYNAGQVDFRANEDGSGDLVKVNNHVWTTSKNNVELSPERILEVKEVFLNALRKSGVNAEAMKEIRDRLGLPTDLDIPADGEQRTGFIKARFTPLTRAQVRSIIDEYANEGKGFTHESLAEISYDEWEAGQATANMSASRVRRRDNANIASMALHVPLGTAARKFTVTDSYTLEGAADGTTVVFMTPLPCKEQDGAVVLSGDGFSLRMTWPAAKLAFRLEEVPMEDPPLRNVWGERLYRLCFDVKGGRTKDNFSFEVTALPVRNNP